MLQSISWANYLFFVFITLAIWYTSIAFKYYKTEIINWFRYKSFIRAQSDALNLKSRLEITDSFQDPFAQAFQLKQALGEIFQRARREEYPKEEMVMAMQVSIRAFPGLKESAFEIAINNYIIAEASAQCSTTLSEGDLRMVWKG